ncbi:MAG: S8 family serine peptidase [bacterium]
MGCVVSILIFNSMFLVPGKIMPELGEILKNAPPLEKIPVIVHMSTEYPLEQIQNLSPQEKCNLFKTIAYNSQKDVLAYLKRLPGNKAEVLDQFWIFNGFHLKATKDVIEELAGRNDIKFICYSAIVKLDYTVGGLIPKENPKTPEWNIKMIMADSCWNAGYDGSGVIIGHIDTGVLTTHQALSGKWLSPYWYDAVNGMSTPYDDQGHGTHIMGTICGGDGPGPFVYDVGIAYGARYIPTKGLDASGVGYYYWLDDCMQYLANLKAQGINIRVISNSWGSSSGSDLHFWDIILHWKNLGVFPVFAAGSGQGYGTINSPASFCTVAGVGATRPNDTIANFSSQGPAPNIPPINNPQYWYYPEWNLLKPDFCAPGVNIRSCSNNGGYATFSGTSFATPHLTGGTAILLQKNPNLTLSEIYSAFKDNCDMPSWGGPYPNNTYGWGRINLWKALKDVPPTDQPCMVLLHTRVVNDDNGNGRLDPGENGGIITYVKNSGGVTATNVQGTLRTTSPYITIIDSTYTYGTINPGDSTDNFLDAYEVSVDASTPPGHKADFKIALVSAETSWVRNFSLTVGYAPGMIIWGPKYLPSFPADGSVRGLAYDRIGDMIYVIDYYSNSIYIYSSDSFVTYYGTISGPATNLTDIAYSFYDDALYVCGFNPKNVWKIDKSSGEIIRQFNNPANDFPTGIAYDGDNTMWFADRRSIPGATQLIYIGDTLGNAIQYNSPVQGYYNTHCLAYDSLGNSFVNVQTWFDPNGVRLDSVGVVEMEGSPPISTGNRFLLIKWWHIWGIEYDPRDGNYWITIASEDGARNKIVKVKGFYTPSVTISERKSGETSFREMLKVIPNPSKNTVSFYIHTFNIKDNHLWIYDIAGRVVAKVKFDKNEKIVNWNSRRDNPLADGIYFAILKKDNGMIKQKFILIH